MLHWLHGYKSEFDRVFACDGFDVFFEDDPFQLVYPDCLSVFEEGETISRSPFNNHLVRMLGGNKILEAIRNCLALNSGTIGGPVGMFLRFLEIFAAQDRHIQCHGVDQGILNILVHTGLLNKTGVPYIILGYQYVMTLYYCPADQVTLFSRGRATFPNWRRKGVLVPVVHGNGAVSIKPLTNRCRDWMNSYEKSHTAE
jgi:hypothetical protein